MATGYPNPGTVISAASNPTVSAAWNLKNNPVGSSSSPSFGQQLAAATPSFRNLTQAFAAGFAKDPAVRQQYSQQQAYEEQQRQQQASQQLNSQVSASIERFKVLTEVMAGRGLESAPEWWQKSVEDERAILDELSARMGSPGGGTKAAELAYGLAQMPAPAAESQFQQFYNPQTRQSLAVDVNNPQAIAQAQQQGFTTLGSAESSDVLSPEAYQQQVDLSRAKANNVTVQNVMPQQETESAKAIGKGLGEEYVAWQKAGMGAEVAISKYQRLGAILSQVNTGKYKGTTNDLKKAAKSAGVDLDAWGITDDTGLVDAAQALSRELALQIRNPAGGAGMPGAMSDADRQFLESMVASVETDPAAMPLMIEAAVKIEQRNKDVARIAREYKAKNKGAIDDGVYDVIAQYAQANPLFTDADAKRIGTMGKATGAPQQMQPNIPKVTNAAQYNAVPSGSQYYDPAGVLRTKP